MNDLAARHRVAPGVPAGGEFAARRRTADDVTLTAGTGVSDVEAWLDANGLYLPEEGRRRMAAELSDGRPVTDLRRADVFRATHELYTGLTHDTFLAYESAIERVRRTDPDAAAAIESAFNPLFFGSDEPEAETTVPATYPTADDAESIVVNGMVLHRYARDAAVLPLDGGMLRIAFDRDLTADERDAVDSAVRYAAASVGHRDSDETTWADSPRSAVFEHPFTYAPDKLAIFLDRINTVLAEGSPIRVTDRNGPAGSRAVEPFPGELPPIQVYLSGGRL